MEPESFNQWLLVVGPAAAVINLVFVAYNFYQLYIKKLKFSLHVDNWAEIRHRCCDATCPRPHLDFQCTLVVTGPKDKIADFVIHKTHLVTPSKLKVEASPNNHLGADGKFWGSKTPIIGHGGEKLSFVVSYQPEIDSFKAGLYSLTVVLKERGGKLVESEHLHFSISETTSAEITKLPRDARTSFEIKEPL